MARLLRVRSLADERVAAADVAQRRVEEPELADQLEAGDVAGLEVVATDVRAVDHRRSGGRDGRARHVVGVGDHAGRGLGAHRTADRGQMDGRRLIAAGAGRRQLDVDLRAEVAGQAAGSAGAPLARPRAHAVAGVEVDDRLAAHALATGALGVTRALHVLLVAALAEAFAAEGLAD